MCQRIASWTKEKSVTHKSAHWASPEPEVRRMPCSSQAPRTWRERWLQDSLTGGWLPWSCRNEVLLVAPARQFCRTDLGSQFEMVKEKREFFRGQARRGRQIQNKTRTDHTTQTEECTGSGDQDGRLTPSNSQKQRDYRGIKSSCGPVSCPWAGTGGAEGGPIPGGLQDPAGQTVMPFPAVPTTCRSIARKTT